MSSSPRSATAAAGGVGGDPDPDPDPAGQVRDGSWVTVTSGEGVQQSLPVKHLCSIHTAGKYLHVLLQSHF